MRGLISSRSLILLVLLVVLFMDFKSRLSIKVSDYSTELQDQVFLINPPVLTTKQLNNLEKLYAPFSDVNSAEPPEFDKSAFEENIKSDPTKVLIEGHVLELRAIVTVVDRNNTADSSYALISNTNMQTSESEVVKVLNNDALLGYRLSVLSNIEVKLIPKANIKTDNTEQLTLAMYKKHSKNSQK